MHVFGMFFIKSFGEVWKLKVIYVTNWKMLFKAVFPTGVLSRGPLWPLYLAVWDFLQKAFEVQTKSKSTKLCKKMHFATFRHEGLNSAVMITWKNKMFEF